MQGIIIEIIANLYRVKVGNNIYDAVARGKLKQDEIFPVVGDRVMVQITEEQKATIEEILPRKNYCKRPKVSNLSQMIFVVSLKMPKPDLFLLDKQIAFAEWLGISPIVLLNKIDLEKNQKIVNEIASIYENIGYTVLKTNAKALEEEQILQIQKLLKNQTTAFSGNSGVRKIYFN